MTIGDIPSEDRFSTRSSQRARCRGFGTHQLTCLCHCPIDNGILSSSLSGLHRFGAVYMAPINSSRPSPPRRYKSDVGWAASNRNASLNAFL